MTKNHIFFNFNTLLQQNQITVAMPLQQKQFAVAMPLQQNQFTVATPLQHLNLTKFFIKSIQSLII